MSKKDRFRPFPLLVFSARFLRVGCILNVEHYSQTMHTTFPFQKLTQSHSEMFSCLNEIVKQLVWNSHMKRLS